MFCVLILGSGVLSEAENGAVHWLRSFWTQDGQCIEYEFWQESEHDAIYVWRKGMEHWHKLDGFDPTPGRFAFVTDKQWIAEALQNQKTSISGYSGGKACQVAVGRGSSRGGQNPNLVHLQGDIGKGGYPGAGITQNRGWSGGVIRGRA